MPRRPKRGERIIAMSLRKCFSEPSGHVGSNEVLVQEIIPGDGTRQFSASCVFMKNDVRTGKHGGVALASTSLLSLVRPAKLS